MFEEAKSKGLLSAKQGRAWLRGKLRREMAWLREQSVALQAERCRDLDLVADSILSDESPGAALMRRYESAAMTDLGRCVTLLARLRKEREFSPTPTPTSRTIRQQSDSAGAPIEAIETPGPEAADEAIKLEETAGIGEVAEIETSRETDEIAEAEAPNEPSGAGASDSIVSGAVARDRPSCVNGVDRGGRAMRSRWTIATMLVLSLATAAIGGDPPSTQKKKPRQPTPVPELNRKIVEYARSKVGEKVDNGECTRLAGAAIRDCGGKLPKFLGDEDYVWGDLVATYTAREKPVVEILPGDILQFRDARVVSTTRSRGLTTIKTRSYPHHTAVVASASGRSLKILHQNVGSAEMTDAEKKLVKEELLPLLDLKGGTIWVYRPVVKNGE